MKKIIASFCITLLALQPLGFAEDKIISINSSDETKFQGLYRTEATKIPNGGHVKFDNVYIEDGTIRAVKGRDRLNSTAHSETTVKGMAYYENSSGTTKKIIVKEASSVVSYETDGTSRAVLLGTLTDEYVDFVQIGDTLYWNSVTDGLKKWSGSGSAATVGAAGAGSTPTFSSSLTVAGGMTPGSDIGVTASITTDDSCAVPSTYAVATGCTTLTSNDVGGQNVAGDDGTLEEAATSSTYKYKATQYSSLWGIESEAGSATTVTLTGDDKFSWSATNCQVCDTTCTAAGTGCADGSGLASCCAGVDYVTGGSATSTTATAGSGTAPFNTTRIYRTVAGGSEFFLVGEQNGGTFTDGKPDVSLGNPLDTTIDTITPPTYRYIAEFKGTIFTASGAKVAFNRLPVKTATDADTYWLATDNIDIGTNDSVSGLQKTADSLIVFTPSTIKEITGFGASNFKVLNLVNGVGAISDEAIETDLQGDLIFFGGASGVYKLRTFDQPQVDSTGQSVGGNRRVQIQRISSPALDRVFQGLDDQIVLTTSDYSTAHSYYDSDKDFYFLYIGSDCFIYDNKLAVWSHEPATKFIGSLYRKSPSSTGTAVLVDNLGFFYNNWTGYENGIQSGTVTGNPTSSASTTLTDSGATFNTTGDGLKGLWVYISKDAGEWRQITSNTSTAITVSSAWTVNPVVADTYYIAYIIPDFQTKQYSFGQVPEKTNVNFIYVIHGKSDTSQSLEMDLLSYVDKSTTAENAKTFDLTTNYVDKIGTKGFGFWHDWEMKTYIYNTSNTINPPLNVLEYGLSGEVVAEE